MIPVRPAIVTGVSATYGQCRISDVHDDPFACVCGQVFMSKALSGWSYAYDLLNDGECELDFRMVAHGFALPEDGDAWVELVKERFDTGTFSDVDVS